MSTTKPFSDLATTDPARLARVDQHKAAMLDDQADALVVFYGASDDLIEVDGNIPGCDEYPGEHGTFELAGLRIEVAYMAGGVWGIRVSQIDEDVPVTAKSMRLIDPDGGLSPAAMRGEAPAYPRYSIRLEVIVPAGSHVTKVAIT